MSIMDDQGLLPLEGLGLDPEPVEKVDAQPPTPDLSDGLTPDRHGVPMNNNSPAGSGSPASEAQTLEEISRLVDERERAWAAAHDASRALHEAIEASGISPTKISRNANISRSAIYSLKGQVTGETKKRLQKKRAEEAAASGS